jgi:hypothetical protein
MLQNVIDPDLIILIFEHFPDPMGKCSNAFFSETTNQTESKLDRNVHWMFIYYNWKSKMAATAGHKLTMGKCSNMSIMRSGSMTFCSMS